MDRIVRRRRSNAYNTPQSNRSTAINSRRSSTSSGGYSTVGRAARFAANLHPYGRAALIGMRAGRAVKNAFQRFRAQRQRNNPPPRAGKRGAFTGHSIGVYQGRFKKPKKIKRTIEQMCLSKGMHTTLEQFGTVSDPDAVFVSHSTGHINEISRNIAFTLMRELMTKAGFRISNQLLEIANLNPTAGLNAPENSDGLRFVYTKKNQLLGTYTNYTYDTIDNQNFLDIIQGFTAFNDQIIDFIRGTSQDEPFKVAVFRKDYGVTTNTHLAAELFIEDIKLDLFFQSTLTIQNRSKAAVTTEGTAAEQASTTRVDSQPLKGYIYEFKNADPRVRHLGPASGVGSNLEFNYMQENGLKLIRGATFIGAQEPFVPKYFANVAKAIQVTLNPGDIKKTSLDYKMSGTFKNVIKKIKVTQWQASTSSFSGMSGKCQMMCLEELLRTPSTNKITLAYERELKIGVIIKEKKSRAPLESRLLSENIDNNVA